MKTLKNAVVAIGRAVVAILGQKLPTKDIAVRVHPKAAYGW